MLAAVLMTGLLCLARAQLPPTVEGVTVIKSKLHDGVSISFKEPGICETTPGVKSYSGYVHLPPGYLNHEDGTPQDYPINTFFWYFQSRKDPANAPLAIWLNGGPGGSSMMGALQEHGPCLINADSATTTLNAFSWNNEVNMLYIDQPNQVGFSYDTPTNATLNLASLAPPTPQPADFSSGVPAANNTFQVGTFSSQNTSRTAQTTRHAAQALWHFMQAFMGEFPHYRTTDERMSVWAQSYGGHYAPGVMGYFQQQNDKIDKGELADKHAKRLHLDTLGIVNGWVDGGLQAESYITIPYNNTYGIQIFNESTHDELLHNFTKPGGGKDQIRACQTKLAVRDVNTTTSSPSTADTFCGIPFFFNQPSLQSFYASGTAGFYDIAHPLQDPFPPPYMQGYLTQSSVLAALGVPVNFTFISLPVASAFSQSSDDWVSYTPTLAALLDSGVKVHLMYGDRDMACNWVGGEAVSLGIPYSGQTVFQGAGYTEMRAGADGRNCGPVAGLTRQHGNLSFTRVFQAGHEVPAYQPEAAYDIFMRAMFDRDIATGRKAVTNDLVTEGPASTWHIKNKVPPRPEPKCYALVPDSCVPSVWETVVDDTAKIKDWFVQKQ